MCNNTTFIVDVTVAYIAQNFTIQRMAFIVIQMLFIAWCQFWKTLCRVKVSDLFLYKVSLYYEVNPNSPKVCNGYFALISGEVSENEIILYFNNCTDRVVL